MTSSGQILSDIVAQLCLENSIQTLQNFFGVDPKKIKRVCMEFSEYKRLTSQRQFAPKCSFLVRRKCFDLLSNSLNECMEISFENLYLYIRALSVKRYAGSQTVP